MTAIEKMIKSQRDCGWDDNKIWLHRKFMAHYFSSYPYDSCQWCGGRAENILYLVPGIFSDGKMNWICYLCAVDKYGRQIVEEMEQYINI